MHASVAYWSVEQEIVHTDHLTDHPFQATDVQQNVLKSLCLRK